MNEPEAYDVAPGNEELRFIGAFDRKTKVGKHQAANRYHLRAIIQSLDAAGFTDAADTMVWQVWLRENGVARAHESLRLANAERNAAKVEITALQSTADHLRAALEHTRNAADDLASVCLEEGDGKAAGALQFISGLIRDHVLSASASIAAMLNAEDRRR